MLIRPAEALYFPCIPKKNTAVYSALVRDEIVQPDGTVTRKVFSLRVETETRINSCSVPNGSELSQLDSRQFIRTTNFYFKRALNIFIFRKLLTSIDIVHNIAC